jgi:Uma2 family endonuclease
MSAVKKLQLVSVDDYLAGELKSPIRHEYLGGFVYAMAGGKVTHTRISGNIFAAAHHRLRRPCEPFNPDMKIRIQLPTQTRFYYPDVSITCAPNPPDDSFLDAPAAIFEVLSRSTRRIDEGEKKEAYLTIPSLGVYLLVEQAAPLVAVYRRTKKGFEREVYEGLDAVIPLPEVGIELPLAQIYAGVEFTPEPEDDDER